MLYDPTEIMWSPATKLILKEAQSTLLTMRVCTCSFRLYVALGLVTTSLAQQPLGVVPDLHKHRAEIRAALLHATPLRSSAEDVLQFIRKDLQRQGESTPPLESRPVQSEAAADSTKRGVKNIHLRLGNYIYNPAIIFLSAPMLLEKEVTVDWAFNKDNRLIEIFIDKKTITY